MISILVLKIKLLGIYFSKNKIYFIKIKISFTIRNKAIAILDLSN